VSRDGGFRGAVAYNRYQCQRRCGWRRVDAGDLIAGDWMRVIAGEFRSRRLKSIPGEATRPTSDRLRETLFNILQTRIEGAVFVDVYAGTGAVGIEALSRGASHAYFLEKNRAALEAIRENVASLGLGSRATVMAGPVVRSLEGCKGDVVFLDPPYDMEGEYSAALEFLGRKPPDLVIVQHSVRLSLGEKYGGMTRARTVKQGDNALSFYSGADRPTI
jgi:16S rRNA (guanine966-N2)-methyltransferase